MTRRILLIIGKITFVLLLVANLVFSVFLFTEQGNIYKEVRTVAKQLGLLGGRSQALEQAVLSVDKSLDQTVTQLSVREDVASERRNSIKISSANFGEDILELTYKVGSDISKINRVWQDWGDHSQPAKVDNISFEFKGQALSFEFTPVIDPADGMATVVIQAYSATLGKEIQVETYCDLKNRKITQGGDYTKEPL